MTPDYQPSRLPDAPSSASKIKPSGMTSDRSGSTLKPELPLYLGNDPAGRMNKMVNLLREIVLAPYTATEGSRQAVTFLQTLNLVALNEEGIEGAKYEATARGTSLLPLCTNVMKAPSAEAAIALNRFLTLTGEWDLKTLEGGFAGFDVDDVGIENPQNVLVILNRMIELDAEWVKARIGNLAQTVACAVREMDVSDKPEKTFADIGGAAQGDWSTMQKCALSALLTAGTYSAFPLVLARPMSFWEGFTVFASTFILQELTLGVWKYVASALGRGLKHFEDNFPNEKIAFN